MERLEVDPPLTNHNQWYIHRMSAEPDKDDNDSLNTNSEEIDSDSVPRQRRVPDALDLPTFIPAADSPDSLEPSQAPAPNGAERNRHDRGSSYSVTSETDHFGNVDAETILQAVVFLEDAAMYRSIYHKVDRKTLLLYRHYHSFPVRIFRYFVIFLLHMLAFIETPSSLTWSSDIRHRGDRITIPCGVTECVELICLLLLLTDVIFKIYMIGQTQFLKNKWMFVALIVLGVSLVDWCVTVGFTCSEVVRIRRIFRPFFLIQHSTLMKKTVNCLRRTLPEIASVLLLLALHLYVFTLFGMLLFSKPNNGTSPGEKSLPEALQNWTGANGTATAGEGKYFRTLTDSLMSLIVLLTTANNPDVMLPAYRENRLYAIYFVVFLLIGLYCFMNMLTAVIYNQFRGYFLTSMQSSLFRRRLGVQAAFEVLRHHKTFLRHNSSLETASSVVSIPVVRLVLENVILRDEAIKTALFRDLDERQGEVFTQVQFREFFSLLDKDSYQKQKPEIRWFMNPKLRAVQKIIAHRYFDYFGSFMAFINVIFISAELATRYDQTLNSSKSALRIINFIFIIYYFVEQLSKLISMGWRRYLWQKSNIFDGIITLALVVSEVVAISKYGIPLPGSKEVRNSVVLWNIIRIINILIMVRLLRIIPHIKAMAIVAGTLIDLVKNLKAFGGILVVIFYSFAILGMEIFSGAITYTNTTDPDVNPSSPHYQCGTYEQLQYWANNFDDFAAALVVLWDVMVVNNWYVFLNAYAAYTSKWSYLFFVTWWLLSVVIVLNLFTALILENFIMKWDKSLQQDRTRSRSESVEESHHFMSVHHMFRGNLQEPDETEIMVELNQHNYLHLQRDR